MSAKAEASALAPVRSRLWSAEGQTATNACGTAARASCGSICCGRGLSAPHTRGGAGSCRSGGSGSDSGGRGGGTTAARGGGTRAAISAEEVALDRAWTGRVDRGQPNPVQHTLPPQCRSSLSRPVNGRLAIQVWNVWKTWNFDLRLHEAHGDCDRGCLRGGCRRRRGSELKTSGRSRNGPRRSNFTAAAPLLGCMA